ncbi:MAG: DUF58 domain-containing protein [Firmicutes bacterium]|nr:DUF58 domain-containing protein [Bacillota bacterium]
MNSIISMLIIIILIILLSFLWKKWAIKKVEYDRYVDVEKVFVEDEITITTEIINKKLLPLPWIEIYYDIPKYLKFKDQIVSDKYFNKSKDYKAITSLFSFQRVRRYNKFYFTKRGYYSLYKVKLTLGDYLGISFGEIDLKKPIHITVFPIFEPLNTLILPKNNPQGEISVKRWIIPDPIEILGVRKYTNNDSFNSIDWKSTAKLNKLHVKKFDYTADPSIMIYLDVQTSKIHWQDIKEKEIEKGVSISAAILDKALNENVKVGFTSNCLFDGENYIDFIEPKNVVSQRGLILDALAKVSYFRSYPMKDILNVKAKYLGKSSTIVLITSYLSNELINVLNYLVNNKYSVKLILLSKTTKENILNKDIEIYYDYYLDQQKEGVAIE